MTKELFQFKIVLIGSEPPIWRRFQVENSIDFRTFHELIQRVMGWENCHLYEFIDGKHHILEVDEEGGPFGTEDEGINPSSVYLDWIFRKAGKSMEYVYDFGDHWLHKIVFEKKIQWKGGDDYPICLAGDRACPPEDSGGLDGFYEKLAIRDGGDGNFSIKEARAVRAWLGEYNPLKFECNEINRDLRIKDLDYRKIDEKVEDFLEKKDMAGVSFTLDELINDCGIEAETVNRAELNGFIMSEPAFVFDQGFYHPKSSFLHEFSLRIIPMQEEVEQGILLPGHRILPFQPSGLTVDDIDLTWKGKEISTFDMMIGELEIIAYFAMLDPEEMPFEVDEIRPVTEVEAIVFDMRKFYKEHRFRSGDSIVLQPLKIRDGIFTVRYEPLEEMIKNRKAIAASDQLFITALRNAYRGKKLTKGFQYQLLDAYFHLRCQQPWIPGTPLDLLLGKYSELLKYNQEGRKILHFR